MMTFVDLESALSGTGLRIVVASGVPSPWSQAPLAILRFKKLPAQVARCRSGDPTFLKWNGSRNVPAVLMNDEPVRTGWAEILELSERLAPEAPLLPSDARERALAMGLSHEIMGEGGLLWSARQLTIDAGLSTEGREGFPLRSAQYLAPRYGWSADCAPRARARAVAALALLDQELQKKGPFFGGHSPSAVDFYSAAAINTMVPLPDEVCPIVPSFRPAFKWMGNTLGETITEALVAHRDRMMARPGELPLQL